MFDAVHVAGKATYPVIDGHDIRLKAVDQEIQRFQRRNDPTSGHFNVGTEGTNAACRVMFRIGMHANMAFI